MDALPQIFIHLNVKPGTMWDIAAHARKVDGVQLAYAVTGVSDVIVYAEIEDYQKSSQLISTIQSIEGVVKTQTSMVIPPIERGIL